MDLSIAPHLTYKVDLPGGQTRLREAALYVMDACQGADAFGLTKLNKMLWKADFEAYAARRVPVTGRQYQRLPQGPAPVEMLPVLQDLQKDGFVQIEKRKVGNFFESRPIPLAKPSLRYFSQDDISFVDRAITFYWDLTGRGVSRDSHGVAWSTRENGDLMPYDLALLSDDPLSESEIDRFSRLGQERGWRSH